MKNIANFFFEIGMLKKTPRSGFQFLGSGKQSVAEHSFRTALIGYTMGKMTDSADQNLIVTMCLFHDIPEARTGDLNYVNKKYVQAEERKAINDLATTLPFGKEYQQVLAEFDNRDSLESRLAHDADQLEMILSLKEQKDQGNCYADKWYTIAICRLQTDLAKDLANTIWTTDSNQWWFDDDSEWWVNGTIDGGVAPGVTNEVDATEQK